MKYIMNFNKLQQQLDFFDKELSSEDTSSRIDLYHYTNACAGLNILKTKELWFTNYLNLDDKEELRISDRIIVDLGDNLSSNHRLPLLQKIYFGLRSSLKVFMLSFCEDNENEHLWVEYSEKRTGCTINIPSLLNLDTDYPIVRMKIIYDQRIEKYRSFMRKLLASYLQLPFTSDQNERELWTNHISRIVTFMLVHAPRFKDAHFRNEKEYRLYLMDKDIVPEKNIPLHRIVNIAGKERYILKLNPQTIINVIPGENCKLKQELLNELY